MFTPIVFADREAMRQRLANAGDQLHALGIEQRGQHLAGRDHVADVDFLVDHGPIHRRADGGPAERGLDFIDHFVGAAKFGFARSHRRRYLVVLLALTAFDFSRAP